MTKTLVRVDRVGDIALILIDSPPVNALSAAVRAGLRVAIEAVGAEPAIRGAVLACEGRTFIAGADIREFDQPPREPSTRTITELLDASAKPIVAAIHGTALGGGFEVALACHGRVIAPDGFVGLPEVRIGLIPGAGGTQRVPRVTGALVALDLVTTGRHVPAGEAMALGLVDEVATDLRAKAIARARYLADAGLRPRIGDRSVPAFDRAEYDRAVEDVKRRARGAVAPVRAAEAVLFASELPLSEGLPREQAISLELRMGAQSRALRHLFHAERIASRLPADGEPRPVRHVGVIGGGTMGAGIAIALADAELEVTLIEVSEDAVRAAEGRVRAVYDRQQRNGRLSRAAHAARMGRIRFVTMLGALADADLVIEAVIEDLAAKQQVFRAISGIVRRDAVLASNTSYLDIDLMADMVDAPERVLGLHFFSPAHVMRLLEVVRARRTLPEVLATGIAVGKRLRKLPVTCTVCDGFIGNRILARWKLQCDYALEEGAMPEEVDAALEAYGFAMGPYAVGDLAGLDIGWMTRKRKAGRRDPRERYVQIADWLCEAGRFGQKTGMGWYRHENGKRIPDPVVQALVERASAERAIKRRKIAPDAITARVHATMVNEGCRILAEGVAARPADIDLVLVNGYGYPAWRGGPMHEADAIGLDEVLRRVEAIFQADGVGWEPAPLLREMVAAGRRFAELNG